MERLLTAIEGQLRRAWLAMIGHLRETNRVAQVAGRMQVRDPGAVLHGVEDAAASFAAAEHNAYVTAGQAAARWLRRQFAKRGSCVAKKLLNFDPGDAIATAWAEQNRLDLIRELATEQRILIRDALIGGAMRGVNPRVTAAEIRDAIGLTSYQERIVANYRAQLEAGQYAEALARQLSHGQSDRAIAAAARTQVALTQAQIDTAVERYRANWIAYRAEVIARTEALRVAHQGTEELYRQAIARGDLQADQLERTWNTAHDGRVRTSHRVMDAQTVGFGERFRTGEGTELRFPGDPDAPASETAQCRCVVSTRVHGGAGGADAGVPAGADDLEADAELEEEGAAEEAEAADEEAAGDDAGADDVAADEGADDVAVEDAEAAFTGGADELLDDVGLGAEPAQPAPPRYLQQAQQQQLQRAERRLVERQATHAATRADLEAATAAHEQATAELVAARREVDGFRIGVSAVGDGSEIARLGEAPDVVPARVPLASHPPSRSGMSAAPTRNELPGDPHRTAPEPLRDTIVPSDQPAPVGYEAMEYNGELYYRQRITGRSYTPAQYTERERDAARGWSFDLTGPNDRQLSIPGYQAREVLSRSMIEQGRAPELRYRSERTGQTYTAEQIASGEAAEAESFLIEEERRPQPRRRLLGRIRSLFSGRD